MMTKIKKWVPIDGLPKKIFIESITDNYDGLKILLAGEDIRNNNILITFTNYYGYRNFNESERIRTLQKSPELAHSWSFFVAEHSDLINWLHAESLEIIDIVDLRHYIITTSDDIFEILSSSPPNVREI